MAGPRSPNETSDCLVSSFRQGYLRQISHQLAGLKQGVADIRATQSLHSVLFGQVLEAMRMGKPTEPSPTSGHPSLWQKMKDYAETFVRLSKVWQAVRSVPWGMLTCLGYAALKWLGLA